jgi:4-amino-4-deoxy-L-arabinose transferase-like glycosyltransferase
VIEAHAGASGSAATLRGRAETLAIATRANLTIWYVGAVALVLRLVLQRFEPPPPTKPSAADEVWYTQVAHNVLTGHGFVFDGAQTAAHGPLTVLLLLPATLVDSGGYVAQRATIAIIGALSVVIIGLIARELAGPRVGLVAAALAAVYPGLWVNDLVATSELPAVLLLSVMVLLGLRYRREPTTRRLVLLGLSAGLLALDRAELSLLGVLIALPAIIAVARHARRPAIEVVKALVLVGVLAAVLIAPWSIYNQTRFHRTVLISNNLGQTLVGANCPQTYFGPLTGYDGSPFITPVDGRSCFFPVLFRADRAARHVANANEAWFDAYFRHEAEHYAVHHWKRWPVVVVYRELWIWSLWRPGYTVFTAVTYIGRAQWISWSQIVSFWLLTPLALLGFFVARRRRVRVAPLVTLVVFTAVIAGLVVGNVRYRVSAEVAWVILAAIAIDRLTFGTARDGQSAGATWGRGGRTSEVRRSRNVHSSATNVIAADQRNAIT